MSSDGGRLERQVSMGLRQVVRQALDSGKGGVVWLQGPVGSGKTFLSRELVSICSRSLGSGCCGLYLALRDSPEGHGSTGSQGDEPAASLSVYHRGRGWIEVGRSTGAAGQAEQGPMVEQLAVTMQEWIAGREAEIDSDLAGGLIVVIDDYDRWCEHRGSWIPAGLSEAVEQGAVVLFAAETGPRDLGREFGLNSLLRRSIKVVIELPSEDEAAEIARGTWQGLEDDPLPSGTAFEIVRVTGRYPALVVSLVRAVHRVGREKWGDGLAERLYDGRLSAVIQEAWEDPEVQEVVQRLLGTLAAQERFLLALYAIAHESNRDVGEILAEYRKRFPADEWDFKREARSLKVLRLLVAEDRAGHLGYMPSLGLYAEVRRWDVFLRLARELGVPLPEEHPGPVRLLLWVVILTSCAFIVAVWTDWLVDTVFIVGMLILLGVLGYYILFVFRRQERPLRSYLRRWGQ